MQAQDIMITQVVTVRPDATVLEIAKLMTDNRISGVPVVDEFGRLVGIVTDGDIYRRTELGTEKHHNGWLEMFHSSTPQAEDYVAAHGHTARDVMTADVVAVTPRTSLRQIADLFETRRIRRVPVVADGKVAGIVSRANLVQALASIQASDADGMLADRRIRDLVVAEFKQFPWSLRSEGNVIVKDGILHLWGFVSSDVELAALRVAAEAIPGVKGFEDHTVRLFGEVGARLRTSSKVTVVEPDGSSC